MRADSGKYSYNVAVTSDELWRRVGRVLTEERERRGLNWTQVGKLAGVDMKTIKAGERGKPKTVRALERHAEAFKMSLVDIVSAVIQETAAPLSPEAATLLRCFEALPVPDRQHVLTGVQRAFELFQERQRLEAQLAAGATTRKLLAGPGAKSPKAR